MNVLLVGALGAFFLAFLIIFVPVAAETWRRSERDVRAVLVLCGVASILLICGFAGL